MSTFLVTSDGSGGSGVIAPTDASGIQLVIGPARYVPWLMTLPSGLSLCVYYDDSQQALFCRTVGENADHSWTLGAPVRIVSTTNGGFAAFCSPQKVCLGFGDGQGGVRFGRSFDEGDTWEIGKAEG